MEIKEGVNMEKYYRILDVKENSTKDAIKDAPSDIKHYEFIKYELGKDEDFFKKLEDKDNNTAFKMRSSIISIPIFEPSYTRCFMGWLADDEKGRAHRTRERPEWQPLLSSRRLFLVPGQSLYPCARR